MQRVHWLVWGLLLAALVGCSNKQVYDGLKQGNRNDCLRLPPNQQAACLEQVNQSYEDYQREREMLEQQP
jgi:type III secretory pathway lipoprotein EscJ